MNPAWPENSPPSATPAHGNGLHAHLLDEIGELVWSLTPDGQRLLYVNQAATALFDVPLDQLRARDRLWLGVINPQDKATLLLQLKEITEQGQLECQFRVLRSDGSERVLDARFRLIRNAAGEPEQIAVIARDSSDWYQAQRSLTEWRSVYESLVENLPIKVFRKNRHGRLVFCNQIYCDAMGMKLDDLLGKTDEDLFPPELARKYRDDDRRIIDSGHPYHGVEEHRLPDGTVMWVEVIKSPLRDSDGRRIGIQGVFWDVTERVDAERKLQQARDMAEKATRLRGEFLANVSHEIRTPMNGVLGLTELLLDTRLDRTQQEYLTMIRQSAEGLMTLINDILDFSKIESGKMELDLERFQLRDWVGETVRALAVRAHAKGLELVVDLDPELPGEVIGDALRLRQVITNLVGNAIKFTSAGQVVVRLTRTNDDFPAQVLFEVIDSGVGIPADRLESVFRDFEQVDVSTTRQYGGTGLGLSIARQIVEMMGGQIRVASQPGQGSRFWFSLELPVGITTASITGFEESLAGLTVLVVDDHPDSLRAIGNLLRTWNVRVLGAATGAAALEQLAQQTRAGRTVNAVLIDGSLPDADSTELARRVMAGEGTEGAPPQVALLAVFQPGVAVGSGLELDRIHKPVTARDLGATLQAMLGISTASSSQGPASGVRVPGARVRVLLAEDNLVNQRVATAMLQKLNCEVTVVGDGRDAVRLAARNEFDLVFMDVQMPEMDGLDATRAIRQLTGPAAAVPVVGLSAHAGQEIRLSCLSAGMNSYIAKPIRRSDIDAALQALKEPGSSVSGPLADVATPAGFVVDWELAMSTVGGDRKLLQEIISIFISDSATGMQAMDLAIREGDAAALRRLAHSMRGSLNYLGAREAMAPATELEQLALSADFDQARNTQKRLAEAVQRLTLELGRINSR